MEKQTNLLLRLLGVKIATTYVREILFSHPDYPSILSITDTLQQLGIPHAAVQISKSRLNEVPVPFLAHIRNTNTEDILLIKNLKQLNTEYPNFINEWDGVIITAEKPKLPALSEEVIEQNSVAQNYRIRLMAFCLLATLLAVFLIFQNLSWKALITNLLLFGGFSVSVFLILQELGISNTISEKICGKRESCLSLSAKSENLKLPYGVKLSDVGLGFFSGFLFLLLISELALYPSFEISYITLLTILSLFGLPLLAYLLYFQALIAKQWCRLCLLQSAILVSLALLQIVNARFFWPLNTGGTFLLISLFIMPGSLWLLIRHTLEENRLLKQQKIALKRFKRDPNLFITYLFNQDPISVNTEIDDIFIGNRFEAVQLIMVCNPYCKPCAQAHHILHELLLKTGKGFGLSIRFALSNNDLEDMHYQAAEYILRTSKNYPPEKVIIDWYTEMNLGLFRKRYPLHNAENVRPILINQKNWAEDINIEFTPTIFINGYRLSKPYFFDDLPELWGTLSEIFTPELAENSAK